MRILHTADWHIGKVLHKHPLQDELKLFFDWLLQTVEEQRIDLLLVAGDIFDLANPSAADRQLYYDFLHRLSGKKLQIIITGGNHDSIGFLNAPKEILNALHITVVGGACQAVEDELIPVYNAKDEIELIVAAVPFLRDKDLRNKETDQQYKSRAEAIREGIKKHYRDVAEKCEETYPGIPCIAMGHLFTVGAQISESERDIHVGNQAAVSASAFPDRFGYIALGHIHRPQVIGKNQYIRYSGSPIPLSFSEKEDKKSLVLLELQDGKLGTPEVLEIPRSRELRKFSGDLNTVKEKLARYAPDFPLPSFVEIEVREEAFSPLILSEVQELLQEYAGHSGFKILKDRTHFKTGIKDTSDLFKEGEHIEDLRPVDVFSKRLEMEALDQQQISWLKDAFREVLETIEQDKA